MRWVGASARGIVWCLFFAVPCCLADVTHRALGEVELTKQQQPADLRRLPTTAPKPVLYFLPAAHTPSCGLIRSGERSITPILETDEQSDFPYCQAITAAAMFRLHGTTGYVFRFEQRDTREDKSTGSFFVLDTPRGLEPAEALNGETAPNQRPIDYLATWGKARLTALSDANSPFKVSLPHSIVTDQSFLNVSQDETSHRCQVTVGTIASDESLLLVVNPCASIAASTSLVSATRTYYILLTKDDTGRTRGNVFVATDTVASEDTALEMRLVREIDSGEVLRVRGALRKLVAAQ